jgi:hypothetical protein
MSTAAKAVEAIHTPSTTPVMVPASPMSQNARDVHADRQVAHCLRRRECEHDQAAPTELQPRERVVRRTARARR